VLARCLVHSPNYVVHAPLLLQTIREMLRRKQPLKWVSALVHAAGTVLIVRCVQEMPRYVDYVIKGLFYSCNPEAQDRLVQLWPSVVCKALGRPAPEELPPVTAYECPVTQMPCVDPVVASDGHTYERDVILRLIADDKPSPLTRDPLNSLVVENRELIRLHPPA